MDDRIAQLRKQILPLQGHRYRAPAAMVELGLGSLNQAFPLTGFPSGAVHEFLYKSYSDFAASCGFISGILSGFMKQGNIVIWLDSASNIFPPALAGFSIDPCNIIFIDPRSVKEMNWVLEECLGCEGLAAVIANIPAMDFTFSRRLQLAVEKTSVTAFILRDENKHAGNTACIARWKIRSLPSETGEMPGVGFPRWKIELLKIRNGWPGQWTFEWMNGAFAELSASGKNESMRQRKAV